MTKRTESYIWKKMKKGLPQTHLTRHEEDSINGVPDVSYGTGGRNGWIELKSYRLPPSLVSVPRFSNLKRTQRSWLRRRGTAGGNCWLLVGFGDNVMLLAWYQLPLCGEATFEELIDRSIYYGSIKDLSPLVDYI